MQEGKLKAVVFVIKAGSFMVYHYSPELVDQSNAMCSGVSCIFTSECDDQKYQTTFAATNRGV